VILTSHSPIAIEEIPNRVHVVRPGDTVEILPVPNDLVATLRRAPEAFSGVAFLFAKEEQKWAFVELMTSILSNKAVIPLLVKEWCRSMEMEVPQCR